MKKLTTFWYSFQKSLLDPQYYRDIARASFRFSFKYLFLLLVCLSLVRSVQLGYRYSKVHNKIPSYIATGKSILLQLYPKELELRISNGKLYTNVVEPYVINFPPQFGDMGVKHFIVIDTNGVADNYPKYNTLVLATRQALVYPDQQQGNKTTTQMYYFSDMKQSVYIDYSIYTKMVQSLNPFVAKLPHLIALIVVGSLVIFPIVGGFFWLLGVLFGLLLLTLFTWLMAKIFKVSYTYKTLYRLGMHAVTWSILFSFILDMTHVQVPSLYNLIFVVWMGFILFMIRKEQITP